jgi:zinc finger protein
MVGSELGGREVEKFRNIGPCLSTGLLIGQFPDFFNVQRLYKTFQPPRISLTAVMASNSVSHLCLRAARTLQRQSRRIRPHPHHLIASNSPSFYRLSSTSASIAESQPDDWNLTGKQASLRIKPDGTSDISHVIVGQDDLFHPLSTSPIPSMRQRAAFIRAHAYCPHPSHTRTRTAVSEIDPEARKPLTGGLPPAHVDFECPHCGIPVSCSEEHWADDFETHMQYCDTLRTINEDDHDIRSGRQFQEFNYPDMGIEEAAINFTNWDTLLYTREFSAINEERSLRHATKLLTYPMTIGSILHEYSPYNIKGGGQLTPEGLRSITGMNFARLTAGFKLILQCSSSI